MLSKKQGLAETTATSPAESHLLSLSAELRNSIYNLCFAQTEFEVDLLQAQLPNKALLLTCRQIRDEARLLHRKACKDFWSKSKFTVLISNDLERDLSEADHFIRSLDDRILLHISSIVITSGPPSECTLVWNAKLTTWTRWYRGPRKDHHTRDWQEL